MPKVPLRTSVYYEEPIHQNINTLGFAPELIDLILKGKKVKSYKFGLKKNSIREGGTIYIENSISGKIVGKARVIRKTRTRFLELPLKEPGHESYDNKEHQRRVFSGYYAYLGRKIRDDDPFLVFEFELIKS